MRVRVKIREIPLVPEFGQIVICIQTHKIPCGTKRDNRGRVEVLEGTIARVRSTYTPDCDGGMYTTWGYCIGVSEFNMVTNPKYWRVYDQNQD